MNIKYHQASTFLFSLLLCLSLSVTTHCWAKDSHVVYHGGEGPGKGKHVVLISGDEEYRSEEMLPQLGKILATHHGFKCTVLFAMEPKSGMINPNASDNIPGLESLADADLMVIFTRFRALPDDQMQQIHDYLVSGKPVIGIRTATHAFNFPKDSKWKHYSNGYRGEKKPWHDGFGRLVLGEKWISHHGSHKHESTRGIIAPDEQSHPILRGIRDGDVWGPTDVYGVRLPLPADSRAVVLGQVLVRQGEFDGDDALFGMRSDDQPRPNDKKNNPMMQIAWTKSYQLPDGKQGSAFMSTIGASTDFLSEGNAPAAGQFMLLVARHDRSTWRRWSQRRTGGPLRAECLRFSRPSLLGRTSNVSVAIFDGVIAA